MGCLKYGARPIEFKVFRIIWIFQIHFTGKSCLCPDENLVIFTHFERLVLVEVKI